ncbi:MAG: sulfotransferase [Flavobacteriales bacterium]|nr:sulfotransferase [Flavobacteriales bacterium]
MGDSKLILIGSAPSSGSTLLADLLDSSPFTACGPELEFFCNRAIFDFETYKGNPSEKSELFSLRASSLFPRYERLHHYGTDKASWMEMIRDAKDLDGLSDRFAHDFLRYREKPQKGIVFEKTPQNVNAIDLWIEPSDRAFVFLVRDPLYVFNSLLNRGWGTYTAFTTWLLYAAKCWKYLDHPNVTVLRLEDLVREPFERAASLIQSYTKDHLITPDALRLGFEQNAYRKSASKKLDTWGVQESAGVIRDPNAKEVSADRIEIFQGLLGTKVSEEYAKRYGLDSIGMQQALERFGYDHLSAADNAIPSLSRDEWLRFARKTLRGVMEGHGSISDFRTYARALEVSQ